MTNEESEKMEQAQKMTGTILIRLYYTRMEREDRLYLERALVNTLNHVSNERGIKMVGEIVG
jgi:hypothetical protein